MIAIESGSVSSADHRHHRRFRPAFASNRLRRRRLGPCWASVGFNSGLPEISQGLQLVAGRHHRHRKARPRLTDGTKQHAAQLVDGGKQMLDSRACLGDALVAPLLALGQRLVAMALALDLVADAVFLQPGFTLRRRIVPVGIDVPASGGRNEDLVEVLAVVRGGRVGLDLADELVFLVDVDGHLVAEEALAVLLGPGRVDVLLVQLDGLPAGWHRALIDKSLLSRAGVLLRGWHQGGVDDLAAAGNEAFLELLCRDAIEQRLGTCFADMVLEGPDGGAIGDVRRAIQPAEALEAHPVEQLVLHLLVREVVEPLQDEDAHHRLGRVWRPATLRADRPRRDAMNLDRQRHEVDVRLDLGQRIAQGVDLLVVIRVGKQVALDGATGFNLGRGLRGSEWRDSSKRRVEEGFSRCPLLFNLLSSNFLRASWVRSSPFVRK